MIPYRKTRKKLERIRALREDEGLSYRAIAKEVGMGESAVYMLCRRYGITAAPRVPILPVFPGVLALARARLQKHERNAELARYWRLSA